MNRKKRILFCTEATYVSSGFGKYGHEVMKRLHATGKYELAEHATYGKMGEPQVRQIPWLWYPNQPLPEDEQEFKGYQSAPVNQFGKWRFERVLLDFKPDIVWDIRDHWMQAFEKESPYRRFFHWALMPTVDSYPQKEEWINTFSNADGVLGYEDFGIETLGRQGGNKINLITTASPGADLDLYKPPQDKRQHKAKMGLFEDIKIVGTVMRNQRRKLFPELIRSFRMFLDKCVEDGNNDLATQTYLYLHTSYPDMGWDIPALLAEHGVSNKVLFTYHCRNCKHHFSAFFQGAASPCPRCSSTVSMPNVSSGVDAEQLKDILSLFDVYVQYAICEGFGMPQVEAAACGVPVMSVDYSAMSDVVRKVGGLPLRVRKTFRELETGADRVYPDNEYFADELYKFLLLPEPVRAQKGFAARQGAEKYYNWDLTAKTWEDYFDSVELKGSQGKWDSPPFIFDRPVPKPPEGLSPTNFVRWCESEILGDNLDGYMFLQFLEALQYGVQENRGWQPYTPQNLINKITQMRDYRNMSERLRVGIIPLDDPPRLQWTHSRRGAK